MRWEDFRRSQNVEDRRGQPGGGGPMRMGGRGGLGIGTIIVLGLMVGFLIYAIYGPIFGLGKVILPDTTKPQPQPVPALSSPE